ncbi:MAG: hypothetical protein ABSG40_14465 [Terriglobales bacterium]|jgi:hypothetical protein
MKPADLFFIPLFWASLMFAQSGSDLRFSGHTLGETAETFFSTATMMESREATKDYCKKLLNDPEAMRRYEAARTGINKKDFLLSDVGGCKDVMAALRGGRAHVGARFASELGKGSVLFVDGKLASFTLLSESSYADAVADMKKRLLVPGHRYASPQIAEGMRWEVGGITAMVFKLKYHDEANIYVGYAGTTAQ